MNKIKKFFVSLSMFFASIISKVYALSMEAIDISQIEIAYGIIEPKPSVSEKIWSFGKVVLPIILFTIGLFVILSKKVTKKVKLIVISSLVLAGIVGMFIMNYLANNF